MTNNSPKHIAFKELIKHKLYSLNNYTNLQRIIESNQFTIIEYKKHANSGPVLELIKKLRIENEIEQNDSFLYLCNNLKFVFINSEISDEDKCSLLRHELGHICDPDFKNNNPQSSRIKREEFANQFSFHVNNPGFFFQIYVFISRRWKMLAAILTLAACVLVFAFIVNSPSIPATSPVTNDSSNRLISESTYYITPTGRKYHRRHCIIIKNKSTSTEIKQSDAINDGYKPCMICCPEE